MHIELNSKIIDITTQINSENNSFSLMKGDSPYFKSVKELYAYYNKLEFISKMNHWSKIDNVPHLVIYIHHVSITDKDITLGEDLTYHASKGEILTTDEFSILNLETHKYL